jgi:SAM-dependent methyltransferase
LRAADAADAALGRRDRFTPPRRLNFVGDSAFEARGDEFLAHFRGLAGLRPEDRVLDIGCGIGRMARVLVPELRPPGSYDGFDVVPEAIAWCGKHYRDTPAPFRFHHADLDNAEYNPGGLGVAARYRFPYDDASFELALAISVFTHLLADATDQYLVETSRVLAPRGRLFATWFLFSAGRPAGPDAAFHFSRSSGAAALADPTVPEAAVAYDEEWLRERLCVHGLRLREPIHYGSWTGRPGVSFQDIIVADRDPDLS